MGLSGVKSAVKASVAPPVLEIAVTSIVLGWLVSTDAASMVASEEVMIMFDSLPEKLAPVWSTTEITPLWGRKSVNVTELAMMNVFFVL